MVNIDAFDDLGMAKAPYKAVAVIPVFGRRPLLKHTIQRLYIKNHVYRVICVGHDNEDRKVCEAAGAIWVQHRNRPLGQKWNAGFLEASKYNPDSCLFVGSSDWVCDDWITIMRPILYDHDMIGTLGCHFLHIGRIGNRLVRWPGYHNNRNGETIGIGRMISRRMLEKMQYRPFSDQLERSLDSSMQLTCIRHAGSIHAVSNPELISLSISTDFWLNKHDFDHHWNENNPRYLPSEKLEPEPFLSKYFPEANLIYENSNINP